MYIYLYTFILLESFSLLPLSLLYYVLTVITIITIVGLTIIVINYYICGYITSCHQLYDEKQQIILFRKPNSRRATKIARKKCDRFFLVSVPNSAACLQQKRRRLFQEAPAHLPSGYVKIAIENGH
jgi:hypothetical protein